MIWREPPRAAMRVGVTALRQQAWRADKLYAELIAYSDQIGCTRIHDEVICDDEQAKLLAKWWTEHTT